MFKAKIIFNIRFTFFLFLILGFSLGTPNYSTAGEEQPVLTYNWIPQFYGKLKGETKLLYTRSFARSMLRFVDIDDDGDDDLFVGKADGRIAFFHNQGSTATPFFKLITEDLVVIHEGVDKQSNAILIQTILDVGNNAAPEFVDIDNDGDFDLLIGSKDGHIFHYENRGNKLSPRFFRKTPIYMGLKFGGNSVPRLADVNGDRTYDLLVGTGSGKIHIFFNSGMTQEAVFCQAFKVSDPPDKRCKFQPELVADIAPQADAVPELVDWDQDKDLDLVVGKSNGKINYYLNTGNNFAPLWSLKSRHFQFIDVGGSAAPTFHDLNQDGFSELFLGTSSSKIIYYENHEILLDLLRKISAIQLVKIDMSASFEKVLSQACSQLRGLPECLVPLAVAFGVPEGTKINRMVELYPFILRPDLSIKSNSDNTADFAEVSSNSIKSEADTSKQQNSVVNANIQDDNKENPENAVTQADQATAAGESETEKDVIKEKIEKLTSQGIITRNQLWLSSRNFLKIENLIGSDRHSFLTSGDWNQDGRIDILLGSRSGKIFAFENRADKGTDWYELKFPVLENNKRQYSSPVLSDIDADGDLDIISGNRNGKLEWILNRGSEKRPEWVVHDVNLSQIDVGSFSTPLLNDMDGDDDLDLLVGNSKGLIIYYENQGNKNTPHFVLRNTRIAGFQMKASSAPTFWKWNGDKHPDLVVGGQEGFLSLISHLPPESSPALGGWTMEAEHWQNIKAIGYSTPHFVDFEGDNKTDLLIGDVQGNLLYWKNGGLKKTIESKQESTLVLTENTLEEEEQEEENEQADSTIITVENTETEQDSKAIGPIEPSFEFVSSRYGNLELGRRAFPAFMDVDGDNNLDLIVGNSAGELRYYRRELGSGDALWTLESKHFLGYQGRKNSAPVFADLDGDGDFDLLVGNQEGSIDYWENKGNSEIADFVYNPTQFIGVTGGRNSVPAVLDLNGDGRNDLLTGNFIGQLRKFDRIEQGNGFYFRLERRKYLNLDIGIGSVPKITDLNNDQQPDLIIGSDSGNIISFQPDPEKPGILSWKPSPEYFKQLNLPIGGNPEFVDLDTDGDLDLIVGSEEGTLYYFRNTGR
ncbi:MAG TPA: hypothetical protein DEP39_01290 [Deltaproteobacteria bacterium]|nr:hypothetical protein [Deltaproteobacteria bacterium]